MEIRPIFRIYNTLLLFFKKSNYNKKKYFAESEEFLAGLETKDADLTVEKANELKKTYITYCEELLHIIDSYYKLFVNVIPMVLFILVFMLHDSKPALIVLGVAALISACLVRFLEKKWVSVVVDYTTEITVINAWVNKYHDLGLDVDFDYLGEQYSEGNLN